MPPSPPVSSDAGAGSERMAHHTISSSAMIGIFRTTAIQKIAQPPIRGCYPRRAGLKSLVGRRRPV